MEEEGDKGGGDREELEGKISISMNTTFLRITIGVQDSISALPPIGY